MGKSSIRSEELQSRDERIMTDLYHTRIMSFQQIARMYFFTARAKKEGIYEVSYAAARECLYKRLRKRGWLTNLVLAKENLNLWMLSRRAFRREAGHLKRDDELYPDWPKDRIVPHYLDTNELYVLLAGRLNEVLGEYPAWVWKNEKRSHKKWSLRTRSGTHAPDAEVHFAGRVYFIERQTERARKTASYFDEKMAGYRGYCDYLASAAASSEQNGSAVKPEVVWACDTERDMDHAFEAAKRHNVPTTVEGPRETCKYIVEEAKKAAQVRRSDALTGF